MGYPMSYPRVVHRNGLIGNYESAMTPQRAIAGDLRRLEQDQRDPAHLERYAAVASITPAQAKAVLDALFTAFGDYPEQESTYRGWPS